MVMKLGFCTAGFLTAEAETFFWFPRLILGFTLNRSVGVLNPSESSEISSCCSFWKQFWASRNSPRLCFCRGLFLCSAVSTATVSGVSSNFSTRRVPSMPSNTSCLFNLPRTLVVLRSLEASELCFKSAFNLEILSSTSSLSSCVTPTLRLRGESCWDNVLFKEGLLFTEDFQPATGGQNTDRDLFRCRGFALVMDR